jgi:dephospho-CoA kinase
MSHISTPALRIGLTGGIGSGKSTVGKLLAERGAAVIDADAIARSVTAPQGLAMHQIAQVFGPEFIDPQGALDRDRMRTHVFAHPEAKKQLEAIIHPLVAQATQAQAIQAESAGHAALVFDVPLLVESGRWRTQVDVVLVVDCLVETQIQRVIARNNLPRDTIEKIITVQASRQQRLAAADWTLFNDQLSLDDLRTEVFALPLNRAQT